MSLEGTAAAGPDAVPSPVVVVTGAAGWLGQNLVRVVARTRGRVRCLVRSGDEAAVLENLAASVEAVAGDVRDPGAADRLFDGISAPTVFHAAGVIHPEHGTRELFDVNVGGTQLILDRARRAGATRFVHVSSNSPFGANSTRTDRFTEDSPYHPYLGYGQSKFEAEQLVQRSHDRGDLATVIVRPPWFYGPYQPVRQTRFFAAVRRGRFPLPGTGTNRRSLVYTGNLVDGLLRAEVAAVAPGRAYWIADAEPVELRTVLATVRSALQAEGLTVSHRQPRLPASAATVAATVDRVLQGRGRYVQAVHVLGELGDTIARDISTCPGRTRLRAHRRSARGDANQCAVVPPAWRAAVTGRVVLVTGGSGYFGTVVVDQLLADGDQVRVFDLTPPARPDTAVEFVPGDIRDREALRAACDDVDVVFHNVAQVPLARDRALFHSVNVVGTANLLVAARDARVAKVVHTSSSAVFGIPDTNPVREDSPRRPLEDYGRAKLEAELCCEEAVAAGLDVTVIRPRTIMGHGRLGIMAVLFEFIADGAPVFVLGSGSNRYQFVYAADLADACLRAATRPGPSVYNVGAAEFGTMREALEALVAHAATGSRVRSLPAGPARLAMHGLARLGLAPFAPYHWLLYGESLWFDVTRAREQLGWEPSHSNVSMLIESYDWFLEHRAELAGREGSRHQSPARLGLLRVLKHLP